MLNPEKYLLKNTATARSLLFDDQN